MSLHVNMIVGHRCILAVVICFECDENLATTFTPICALLLKFFICCNFVCKYLFYHLAFNEQYLLFEFYE